jgi:hypothetical protein
MPVLLYASADDPAYVHPLGMSWVRPHT